eukprot:10677509-Ditylum_brightwellii.AAC.1
MTTKQGRLNDWMPTIPWDPITWGGKRLELTPNIIGYVPPPSIDSTTHLNLLRARIPPPSPPFRNPD